MSEFASFIAHIYYDNYQSNKSRPPTPMLLRENELANDIQDE